MTLCLEKFSKRKIYYKVWQRRWDFTKGIFPRHKSKENTRQITK